MLSAKSSGSREPPDAQVEPSSEERSRAADDLVKAAETASKDALRIAGSLSRASQLYRDRLRGDRPK